MFLVVCLGGKMARAATTVRRSGRRSWADTDDEEGNSVTQTQVLHTPSQRTGCQQYGRHALAVVGGTPRPLVGDTPRGPTRIAGDTPGYTNGGDTPRSLTEDESTDAEGSLQVPRSADMPAWISAHGPVVNVESRTPPSNRHRRMPPSKTGDTARREGRWDNRSCNRPT